MQQQTDILIIGQGICGSFLSWCLQEAGVEYIIIDESRPYTASKAAAGLINPVTGRRLVTTWMIDELLPFAREAYGQLGASLGINCLEETTVVDFFPTPQMRLAFLERHQENAQYLQLPENEHDWDEIFRYELGYGRISPCYLVNLPLLLDRLRSRLRQQQRLLEESFELAALQLSDPECVIYKNIRAKKIVFCDGIESFQNPWFSSLPFAPNKGEALILDIPELKERGTIFKKGFSLNPWKDGLFWLGSSYEWSFKETSPTEAFRKKSEAALREWLKIPFRIVDHISSVRPATLERRPFVGFHPACPTVGILNGMGTKGCSLAPYFAAQLTGHITTGLSIRPDADVKRFTRILTATAPPGVDRTRPGGADNYSKK